MHARGSGRFFGLNLPPPIGVGLHEVGLQLALSPQHTPFGLQVLVSRYPTGGFTHPSYGLVQRLFGTAPFLVGHHGSFLVLLVAFLEVPLVTKAGADSSGSESVPDFNPTVLGAGGQRICRTAYLCVFHRKRPGPVGPGPACGVVFRAYKLPKRPPLSLRLCLSRSLSTCLASASA